MSYHTFVRDGGWYHLQDDPDVSVCVEAVKCLLTRLPREFRLYLGLHCPMLAPPGLIMPVNDCHLVFLGDTVVAAQKRRSGPIYFHFALLGSTFEWLQAWLKRQEITLQVGSSFHYSIAFVYPKVTK